MAAATATGPEPAPNGEKPGPAGRRRPKEQRFRELEAELAATKEYLQAVLEEQGTNLEELQSSNEELMSANEELQSLNEEMETSKEELQSTNEELATLNEELENRNQELTQANNDLYNLLGAVQIAIVMLGSDLRITNFAGGNTSSKIADVDPLTGETRMAGTPSPSGPAWDQGHRRSPAGPVGQGVQRNVSASCQETGQCALARIGGGVPHRLPFRSDSRVDRDRGSGRRRVRRPGVGLRRPGV